MSHFDEITCMLYLDGQLDPARAAELVSHSGSCPSCRALLSALQRESLLIEHALVEDQEPVPARLLQPSSTENVPWGWIISFGLAAGGAYALWTGIIEPWRNSFSQAGFGESSLLTMLLFSGALWEGWGTLQTTIQILALLVLGGVSIALLRRGFRRFASMALVLSALTGILLLPQPASAAEIKKAQSYALPAGETIDTDLIVTAGNIRIDGTINGDLIVFGQNLTVNGEVKGDIIGFIQFTRIYGQVGGNIRVATNQFTLSSKVGHNVMVFSDNIEIDPKTEIGGSLTSFGKTVVIAGRVNRDLLCFEKDLQLDAYIGGNSSLRGDTLTIGSSAESKGRISFTGSKQPQVSPQAKLAFPVDFKTRERDRPDYLSFRFYLRQFLRWGGAFLLGLVLILLMPRFFPAVVSSVGRPALSIGLGAVAFLGACVLAIAGCFLLIVGVPAALVVAVLAIPAVYSAQVFVGAWLGKKLLGTPANTTAMVGRLALGLLLIRVAGFLPYLGALVWCVVVLWGLGALCHALYRARKPAELSPAAPMMEPNA